MGLKTVISKYASIVTQVNGTSIHFRNHKADVDLATALVLAGRPGYSLSHSDKWKDSASLVLARNMGIGDVLFTSTIPAYIKKVNPEAHITFLTFPRHFRLLQDHPHIDKLEDIAKMTSIEFLNQYDYAMNFNNFFESGDRLNQANTIHRVDMLRNYYGGSKEDWDYKIYVEISDQEKKYARDHLKDFKGKKIIAVITQASEMTRRYPDNPKLINLLAENNFAVVVLSPGDHIKYKHPNVLDMSGKTNISQLWSFLDAADLVISPDSGPLHMAGALDKKIITFFNSFPPRVRTFYYKNCFAFYPIEACPKNLMPCGYSRCTAPCLKSVTPLQFLNKVNEML